VRGGITAADGPQRLFAAIDSKDTDAFLSFIRDDGVFRFGSMPGVQGQDAIREAVDGFFASIAGSRHTIEQSLAGDGTLVFEGKVTYERHNGSELTLPFANVFDLDGDLISTYKIYIDIAPLYAE
jgi:limonene-1,2-epoxide hydrolase